MFRFVTGPLAASFLSAAAAPAEVELSLYTGVQGAPHSRVRGNDGSADFNFLAEWEGKSGEMPPYYGVRATWWRSEQLGYGLEFNHAKVYATDETRADNSFANLELTDGLNIVTFNLFYRWPGLWADGRLTPYAGGGAGVAIPHVDVSRGGSDTFGYQLTGPAIMLAGGASWALSRNWAVFGEYKGTASWHDIDLDNGGKMQTDLITNAANFGVSYRF